VKIDTSLLERLISTPSPSGFEGRVQSMVRDELSRVCDQVSTDLHGNVIGVVNPEAPLRVMLAGHCDEIGLMVRYIDENGYLFFGAIGGVDAGVLPGAHVMVHARDGEIPGVIGRKPIHLMEEKERGKQLKLHELWIDVGAKDRKEAEKVVSPGDPITVVASYRPLMGSLVAGRGFDDRIGVFVVLETMKGLREKGCEVAVYGVSTVQEELGLRGARTSAFGVDPHAGIAIDVGFATDCPDVDKKRVGDVSLGKGPILHRGPNINPVLGKHLEQVALDKEIPFQLTGEPRATGTDANAIQVNRSGVAAALLSIPNRYMHTPAEVISLDDVQGAVDLLVEALVSLTADTDFTPF